MPPRPPKPPRPPGKRPLHGTAGASKVKRAELKAEKDKHIRLLMDILITGQYVTHVTSATLAEQWGVTKHCVEDLASEAARFLRLRLADDDILGVTLIGGLQGLFATAVDKSSTGDAVKSALAIVGIKDKLWKTGTGRGETGDPEALPLELALVDEARAAAAQNEAPPNKGGSTT